MRADMDDPTLVRQFRQILLWPVQLMPGADQANAGEHWHVLDTPAGAPWAKLAD